MTDSGPPGSHGNPQQAQPPAPGAPQPYNAPPAAWQVAAGLQMPFGAPPPPPPEGFFVSRPTSGKAVAGLVCGIAGLVTGFMCPPLMIVIPVGLILSILGLAETGRQGKRSGRGLAIAASILSGLGLIGGLGWIGFLVSRAEIGQEKSIAEQSAVVDYDLALIVKRLAEYQKQNGSLGPGGPVLADSSAAPAGDTQGPPRRQGRGGPRNEPPPPETPDGKVKGTLRTGHLVAPTELRFWGGLECYTLTVTGENAATITFQTYDQRLNREVHVTDVANAQYDSGRR